METFVLRWTKDNLPFWQGVDDGEKIEINAVADVINENATLKRGLETAIELCNHGDFRNGNTDPNGVIDEGEVVAGRVVDELQALLTKETNDDQATSKERSTR